MTIEEMQFCHEYVEHGNGSKAALAVWPMLTLVRSSQRAGEMLAREEVQNYLETLKNGAGKISAFTSSVMSHEEKRQMLAFRLRSKPDDLDDSPFVESISYDDNGQVKSKKFVSWATALDLDNKMAGHNAPEQLQVNGGDGFSALLLSLTGQQTSKPVIEVETEVEPADFGVQ